MCNRLERSDELRAPLDFNSSIIQHRRGLFREKKDFSFSFLQIHGVHQNQTITLSIDYFSTSKQLWSKDIDCEQFVRKKGGVARDNHSINPKCSCERAISHEARMTGNAT